MPKNTSVAVKKSGGEAAAGKEGSNPVSSRAGLLANGAALIEHLLVNGNGTESQSEAVDSAEAEVGAGAATEAAGSGSELSPSVGEGEGAVDGEVVAEETEPAEAGATEGEETDAAAAAETDPAEAGATEGEEADAAAAEGLTHGQRAVNERFAELTAKRKQAEEERDALKAELAELREKAESASEDGARQEPRPPGWTSPVDRFPQVREARAAASRAAATRELAESLLAGEPEAALAQVQAAGVKVSSAEAAVAYLQTLQRNATKAEAKSEARLAAVEFNASQAVEGERKALSAQARVAYPWLNNRKAPERQVFDEVVKLYPFIKDDPAFELVVGDMVAGALARQGRAAAARKANAEKTRATAASVATRAATVARVLPGKPRAVSGAGTAGRGRDGDSIRDQAMKNPQNEEARLRLFERMTAEA